jgi:cytoskeletal protein CcmA (bactofilin family)
MDVLGQEIDVRILEAPSEDVGQRPVVTGSVARTVAVAPPATRATGEKQLGGVWIGKSVFLRGNLISLEDLTIEGRVEGTIELRDHALTIGRDANIQADILAKSVTIFGEVKGAIMASDTVSITETGTVEGDVTSRRLTVADGAVLRGQVDMGNGAARQTIRKSAA